MPAADPLKLIAMKGDTAQVRWAWPEDYRFWGTREYVRGSSDVVRFWVDMRNLQPGAGLNPPVFTHPDGTPRAVVDISTSFDQLNRAAVNDDYNPAWPNSQEPVPYLQKLDRQIRAANDDGVAVILTVYSAWPAWVNGQLEKAGFPNNDKEAHARSPTNLAADSPLGWLYGHLCQRYNPYATAAFGVGPNPYGPHFYQYPGEPAVPSTYLLPFGNPSGAYISALEVCNEPNKVSWPQLTANDWDAYQNDPAHHIQGYVAATQFAMANTYASLYSAPGMFGPASAACDASKRKATSYDPFSQCVVGHLHANGFPSTTPAVAWGWTHHNYEDIDSTTGWDVSTARRVKTIIAPYDWNRAVWLTEGGWNTHQAFVVGTPLEGEQSTRVAVEFTDMAVYNNVTQSQEIVTFSQYGIWNFINFPKGDYYTGMVDGFDVNTYTPGPNRQLSMTWVNL